MTKFTQDNTHNLRANLWLLPRKRRTLSLLVALALALSSAFALYATTTYAAGTITVSTTADAVNGDTTSLSALAANPGPDGISLREAIVAANNTASSAAGPNTINLPAGTYSLGNVGTKELQVGNATNQGTVIIGAGAASTTIHQTVSNQRVFDLDPNVVGGVRVDISRVTITGGVAPGFGGGGILGGGPGNSTTLDQVVITGNATIPSQQGGGISFGAGGNLTITNSTISSNSASAIGAGISFSGRGASDNDTLTIANTTIANNTLSSATGLGAGLVLTGYTNVAITNSTFTGNSIAGGANAKGGAIYIANGPLDLHYSRIVGNSAGSGSGDGVYVDVELSGATLNGTNNWWGCNGGPGAVGCDDVQGPGTKTISPWIVLSNTANPSTIATNGSTTLTASFRQNSAGTALTVAQVSELLGLPVAWSNAVNGTLSAQQTTIQADGTATATFTSTTCGTGSAVATVDNGAATANVTVPCPRGDLVASKTNNVNGSVEVGQSWVWTITVTNNGPAGATFAQNQAIVGDTLPNDANITYGTPVSEVRFIACSISAAKDLACVSTVSLLTLNSGGTFTVQVPATANAAGTFANPRSGGSCSADPGNVVAESDETNNTCSDTVTVSEPPTNTSTNTPTSSPTDSPTTTSTSTSTSTSIPTGSSTSTRTSTPTGSPTSSPTSTRTSSPTSSSTSTRTSTPTGSPTSTRTSSPTGSPTTTRTSSPTGSPTTTRTSSPTGSPTSTRTSTPTGSPTTTRTSSPTSTRTSTPTGSPTTTRTSSPTSSPTRTATSSVVPTCFGQTATIYVKNGKIVGGPDNGRPYKGELEGTKGNDVIVGTDSNDKIEANNGNDVICALGGNDKVQGNNGNDTIDGGTGNDKIDGGNGDDQLIGGDGEDRLEGNDGNDTLNGGNGKDRLEGDNGNDTLTGGADADTFSGGRGTDTATDFTPSQGDSKDSIP